MFGFTLMYWTCLNCRLCFSKKNTFWWWYTLSFVSLMQKLKSKKHQITLFSSGVVILVRNQRQLQIVPLRQPYVFLSETAMWAFCLWMVASFNPLVHVLSTDAQEYWLGPHYKFLLINIYLYKWMIPALHSTSSFENHILYVIMNICSLFERC